MTPRPDHMSGWNRSARAIGLARITNLGTLTIGPLGIGAHSYSEAVGTSTRALDNRFVVWARSRRCSTAIVDLSGQALGRGGGPRVRRAPAKWIRARGAQGRYYMATASPPR